MSMCFISLKYVNQQLRKEKKEEGEKEEWVWVAKAISFEPETKDSESVFSLRNYKPTTNWSFSFLVRHFWTTIFLTFMPCFRFYNER